MVNATKKALTGELDKTWSERLKNMSSSLRTELEKRHKETSDSALAELALLKDKILKEEHEKWNHQKSQLLTQVSYDTMGNTLIEQSSDLSVFAIRFLIFKSNLKKQQSYPGSLYQRKNACF